LTTVISKPRTMKIMARTKQEFKVKTKIDKTPKVSKMIKIAAKMILIKMIVV
jgi:hypothetical protein